MAYGTEARVLFYLGLSAVTGYFSSANITIAIADADNWVDLNNSDADSTSKTNASSAFAAYVMRSTFSWALTSGLTTQGGVSGEPGKSAGSPRFLLQLAKMYLALDEAISYTQDFNIT